MAKTKSATTKTKCSAKIKEAPSKVNPFSQKVNVIVAQAKELLDEPLLLDGFEEFILGFDGETHAVIYDGLGIVNKIVDENMEEDEKAGELYGEWEDYYDRAYEWVINGLARSVACFKFKNGKYIDLTAGRPFPKIMMRFLTE